MTTSEDKEASDAHHPKEAYLAEPSRSEVTLARRLEDESEHVFPIVGIGASAGGLAALKELFAHVPEDANAAFVIVVHLSPEHESHLEELLQPHIRMPVQQVTQTVAIEKNRVYVIPPNANLDTIDTHLRLTQLEKRGGGKRAPIDHFLCALAETHGDRAIGVVLTGTGSDGSMGLRRINARGGLTIVQDPAEAEYDGMPTSAIGTGIVDMVLSLAKIPEAIRSFVPSESRMRGPSDGDDPDQEEQRLVQNITDQIRSRTGRDFSRYKRSTVVRRIKRRMHFNQIQQSSTYFDFLLAHAEEVDALADELLIVVTSFFRDAKVFKALEERVLPLLFDAKGAEGCVRVWSAGCATGEEAYSIAILLLEEAARREAPAAIQVFASDLHRKSLKKAREGFYSSDIETEVSPERLARFFQKERDGYRVRKEVRKHVIFAPHNLLSDPPFSRLDLISCRNLLIYLQRELQGRVIELFQYALQKGGVLLLGTSEIVKAGALFAIEDKTCGIYRKRNVHASEARLPVFPMARARLSGGMQPVLSTRESIAYGELHQQLLEQHGPPSVLVSEDDKILHFFGRAGHYFVQPGGVPTSSLFQLAHEDLRRELRVALTTAREQKKVVRTTPVTVRLGGESKSVSIAVRPVLDPERRGYVLLILEEWPETSAPGLREAGRQSSNREEVTTSRELQMQEQLQESIENNEISQEEIRASNEELQSTNEELHSMLEELETGKEELQSTNEELQTVNQENRHKVEELGQLSSDLQNLLTATDIATLFLDRDMRIHRFTPKLAEIFNVRSIDRGRPLSDITHRLGYDDIQKDVSSVLERLAPIEREVQDHAGRWYLTRVLPYRSGEDRIAGTVVTFVEITHRKQVEDELRLAKEYSEQIIEALPEPLLILTSDHRVHSINAAFQEQFQLGMEQARGLKIYNVGNGQWDIPSFRSLIEDVLPSQDVCNGYRVDHVFPLLGRRNLLINGRRLSHLGLVLLGFHDVTELYAAEEALRHSAERLSRMVNVDGVGVLIFDGAGTVVDGNNTSLGMFGYSREDISARTLSRWDLTPPEYVAISKQQLQSLQEVGRIGPYEKEYFRKNGSRSWMVFVDAALGDGTVVEYCIDVSDRKRTEQALRVSEAHLATELAAMQHMHELVARLLVSPDLPAALGEVLSAAIQMTGATMGTIQLFDPEKGVLEITSQQGFEPSLIEMLRTLDGQDDTACGRAFRAAQRVIVADVQEDAAYEPYFAIATSAGYRSVQSTPFLSRTGAVLGMLSTHYPEPRPPSDRDLRLLDLYARLATESIDRKRTDEALHQIQVSLREENRHKDEFLAMLGHELRNPLAAIKSATELLKSAGSTDSRLAGARGVLERQSAHMTRIIDGLLKVSRIARGKVQLKVESLDLRALQERALHDSAAQITLQGLKQEKHLSSEPLWVMGDEVRLAQVFDNVIGNAIKFTPSRGHIKVSLERESSTAVIRVRDTGIGIRPEMLTHIFEAFRQEPQDAARSTGGLGLGLALAKGLVELHQGTIEAQSAGLGTGTKIEIRLPLISLAPLDINADEGRKIAPRRILIVEDNADAAQMLRELLELRGHDVTVTETGAEALEILRSRGADVVLCDLGLPGMSGYEVARVIREDASLRQTMLIALTGYGQPNDRRRTTEAGFDAHLVKPIALQSLDNLLGGISAEATKRLD